MEGVEKNINEITRKMVKEFGVEFLTKIIAEVKRLDKVASGELLNSFKSEVRDFITSIIINFEYADYGLWIEKGRLPGSYAPPKSIQDYCEVKGIEEKYAFQINHKLFQFGIKPVPFVDNVIKRESGIDEILNQVQENYEQDIELHLTRLLQENLKK